MYNINYYNMGEIMRYLCLSLCVMGFLHGEEVKNFSSYQGFRGVINTPNSEVMQEGDFEFLYTNQIENLSPSSALDFRDNKEQQNFFLNMGLFPNLDLNFQYAYGFDNIVNQKHLSNRVVNAKYQIPFISKDLFHLAIGMQDVGGGNPYIGSKYAVVSKDFNSIRTTLGYSKGDSDGSIDGVFGSIEYQPLSWLQIVGEYDTKEWNGAIKSEYSTKIEKQKINLGVMAKSSLDYNDIYFGIYANVPFNDKNKLIKEVDSISSSLQNIENLKLNNTSLRVKENTLYYEYENTLYIHNDIDALGMVLGILATTTKAENIVVRVKKSNIIQHTIKVNREEYKAFLKTGKYRQNLLTFTKSSNQNFLESSNSNRFKPTLSFNPDFVLIDGGEYSKVMDYTLALQAELSMRLAKGTILSGRYNIPLAMTDNFKENGVFNYRNRNKTDAEIDQLLLTQFLKLDTIYPWVSMAQVGRFDAGLEGVSFESGVSDISGRHHLLVKVAQLKDSIDNLDKYTEDKREEKLLSYRYYLDNLNSNIKMTGGEFLYGDKGESISFERYFSDVSLRFDLSHTKHNTKGTNNLAKLTLSIPLGMEKRFKTKYIDLQVGDITYEKRKTLVNVGEDSYALPHHHKEIDNSFTLEEYYLNNTRFHKAYIQKNYNRLRNIFLRMGV